MVTSKKARTSFLVRDMKNGVGASTLQGTEELQAAAESNGALLQLEWWISIASEDFPKLFRKGVESEGFLQEGHFGVHDAVANHRIAAMAAQEQHL